MVIGVTGGIASGKTTVAGMLAGFGATVIDADQIGRAVVEGHPEALSQLVETFGSEIISTRGTLDRRRLGRMAFSSAGARKKLNSIVHPLLLRELKVQVAQATVEHPERPAVIDAALLLEWILNPSSACLLPHIDITIVVVASETTRIARLAAKGFAPKEARERIRAQLSSNERMIYADYVLHNEGSLEELECQVSGLWRQVCGVCD